MKIDRRSIFIGIAFVLVITLTLYLKNPRQNSEDSSEDSSENTEAPATPVKDGPTLDSDAALEPKVEKIAKKPTLTDLVRNFGEKNPYISRSELEEALTLLGRTPQNLLGASLIAMHLGFSDLAKKFAEESFTQKKTPEAYILMILLHPDQPHLVTEYIQANPRTDAGNLLLARQHLNDSGNSHTGYVLAIKALSSNAWNNLPAFRESLIQTMGEISEKAGFEKKAAKAFAAQVFHQGLEQDLLSIVETLNETFNHNFDPHNARAIKENEAELSTFYNYYALRDSLKDEFAKIANYEKSNAMHDRKDSETQIAKISTCAGLLAKVARSLRHDMSDSDAEKFFAKYATGSEIGAYLQLDEVRKALKQENCLDDMLNVLHKGGALMPR